jgi:hypothetical protein
MLHYLSRIFIGMHLCYVDESGTSDIPGTSSHFVLGGVSIPIQSWKDADADLSRIMVKYGLIGKELHTAWLLRKYFEQSKIPNFEKLDAVGRRSATAKARVSALLVAQKNGNSSAYKQLKKTFNHTDDYIHLTWEERRSLVKDVAAQVGRWDFVRLFAECIDKTHFDPTTSKRSIAEQAFEQLISRFEQYLKNTQAKDPCNFGLIVHDNNETVARKHTDLMRDFHAKGTLWTGVKHIIETPLFVDSKLTGMVQIADLWSYALRRFLENKESELFDLMFDRADGFERANGFGKKVLGVRHFSNWSCSCKICLAHR